MAIGKAATIMFCFMIAAVAIVTIFSIAQKDRPTDDYYLDANNTVNATGEMTQKITTSATGIMLPLVLVVSILFFWSVIMIFKKKGR